MNEQLAPIVAYIQQHLSQGISEQNIRAALTQVGWSQDLVNQAFAALNMGVAPPAEQQTFNPAPSAYVDLAEAHQPIQLNAASVIKEQADVAPKKYGVFRAFLDTLSALKNNIVTYVVTRIAAMFIAAGSLYLLLFLVGIVSGDETLLLASGSKLALILTSFLVVYTLWYSTAVAFLISVGATAVNDGADKKKGSIGATLAGGLRTAVRVAKANFLYALVVVWPLILIIVVPIVFLLANRGGRGSGLLILIPVLMIVAILWIFIATTRFALVPFVALFEPDFPVTKTLGRSKHLLLKGGQWFIVKGFLLTLVILIVMSFATGDSLEELQNSGSLAINAIFIILEVIIEGVLVMLYRNRKAIRG